MAVTLALVVAASLLVTAVAGVSRPAGASPPGPETATSGGAWGTYHADSARSGVDPSGASLDPPQSAWTSPALDGQIYAEPLVWGPLVIVATEHDTVYGLSAADGSVVWSTHVGTPVPQSSLPCGDVDPEGITATPAIEASSGRLFALAEVLANGAVAHELVALDAGTGKVLFTESADPAGMTPTVQQARAAMAVSGGRVYMAYGGLDGDCGSYHGWVVAAPTSGPGSSMSYQVPTHREGGIWAPAGVSVDGAGDVWVATGNGDSTTTYDEGNSVLKLSPTLTLLDSFAPSDWAQLNSNDTDLGSTGPELLQDNLVFQVGKGATGYLLDGGHLGGIGGQLYSGSVCFTIGGDAYRPPDVFVGCNSGVKDVRVTTSPPSFRVAWSGPSGATGPPIFAGGLVWSAGSSARTLYGLDPASGAVVASLPTGSMASFATPAVGDGLLVLATGTTVRAWTGPPTTASKYWLSGSDGSVYSFGSAGYYGSARGLALKSPMAGMAPTPDGDGYWLVGADGGVFTFGDARFFGSAGDIRLNRPIVGMAPTPDGDGYWLVASDGGMFTFGDARFLGSAGAIRLNRPIVGMAPTPDGNGYWLVASDGGIFTFGDARFLGSTGSLRLNAPVVGMAPTPDGNGYWLVASDGGVFTFGDAPFRGSAGGLHLARPVVGMGADAATSGYWLVASDGGVFNYDAPFAGSAAGSASAPIVGMASHGAP